MSEGNMKISNIFTRRNRILLRELVVTDFKLRYQGSAIGYLWSLLKPMFLFGILYVVFGLVFRIGKDVPNFPIYLLLGVMLWGFFTEATSNGLGAIVGRGDLLRKVNFPKYIIVVAGTVSALINLGLNMVIFVVFMILSGVNPGWDVLIFPFLILELYILALSLSFFLSALYVKFRDINNIWEIILQAGFYATPILYPVSLVVTQNEMLAKVLMLSPVAQIIQDSRYLIVTNEATRTYDIVNPMLWPIPFLIVLLIAIFAGAYFKANSKYFAEHV
jgi:ABC-2 type transport system permease protein